MFQHVPTVHQTALDLQALRGHAGRISGRTAQVNQKMNQTITPIVQSTKGLVENA